MLGGDGLRHGGLEEGGNGAKGSRHYAQNESYQGWNVDYEYVDQHIECCLQIFVHLENLLGYLGLRRGSIPTP